MKKSTLILAVAAALVGSAPAAFAHQYYNLTGAGSVASGDSAVGFGIINSVNGTDGVSAGSNVATGSQYRVANGTNTFDPLNPNANNLIPGTGTAASTAGEVSGNLPYMWYSGQHTTATGFTKREIYTGSSVTDTTGNLFAKVISGPTPKLPNGDALPGTIANWGANNIASQWNAYNAKNTGTNTTTWGTIMADLPGGTGPNDHPYIAVGANSNNGQGLGLDYGLIHVSCGANSVSDNCASAGPVLATISITNDKDYPQYSGLLDVALYRGADTSTTSDRNAAYTVGDASVQGSNLGALLWSASQINPADILTFKFLFDQSEWASTDTNSGGLYGSAHTNGFYTLVVGAHGGTNVGVAYDVLVTTSRDVPEPATLWLMASAFAGFGASRRRAIKAA